MPLDLAALVDPAHTAIVTSEVQNGVVGDRSALPALAEAAAPMRSADPASPFKHRHGRASTRAWR